MAQGARTLLQSSRASDVDLGLITLVTGIPPGVPEGTIKSSVPMDGIGSDVTISGDVTMRWAPVVGITALASTGITTLLD